jgi:hypothetical protein
MSKSKVAILRTTPATVLKDYHRLLNLADYQAALPKDRETALKINISCTSSSRPPPPPPGSSTESSAP